MPKRLQRAQPGCCWPTYRRYTARRNYAIFRFRIFTIKVANFGDLKIDFRYIFLQISKLHIPSFHMNQLACPTDIPSGADGCAKMHLEKVGSGARSKMGRAEGVNPHGTLVVYRRLGRIVCTPRKPQRPIFELQSRELARCVANIRRSSLQWDTAGKR